MPAAPAPTEAPPAPTNPESKQTIIVAPPTEAAPPPKPGTARERLFQDLAKRAKPPSGQAAPTEDPPPAPPRSTEQPPTPPAKPQSDEQPPEPTSPAGGTQKPVADKKASPWKLVDEYKNKVIALERQIAERKAVPEEELKSLQERATKHEARNKELEDEIRFVNYRKSNEFKEKFEEPYHRAWKAALQELGELTVETADGRRAVNENDILELVNLPLEKAREIADDVFGKFSNDVMAHRKQLRQLWEAQSAALDDVRKNGEARDKERMEKMQSSMKQINSFVAETWNAVNDTVLKDETFGQYFTPREGDEEGNNKLKKGYDLVDQGWKENPMAPNLTPEERKQIIKRHAAIRNRAAAFSRLVHDNRGLSKRVSELEAKLKEYNGSAPSPGGQRPTASAPQGGSMREQMLNELRKRAK